MSYKLKFNIPKFTFRKRLVVIVLGLAIVGASILFTGHMTRQLRDKEQYEVSLWSHALERTWHLNMSDPFFQKVINSSNNVPFVILDDNLNVFAANLIPSAIINHPDLLRREIGKLSEVNRAVQIVGPSGTTLYIFYGESRLLKMLTYFPFIQMLVIVIFIAFAYITFSSSKHDEQNSVWIGLAKETAHQLGTPTSSLLGWLEYLRAQPIDQTAVEEMNKDLMRLMKVADRFSKIGSETALTPANINETVGDSVLYFSTRVPKNVTIAYNGLAIAPIYAMINGALFEWVVENLLKNSLDALQGRGEIDVNISSDDNVVYIDVSDTGKGIAKASFKRVFEPGYTTKSRGWGLGLSLSKRIIESYHKGKIVIVESAVGRGTTMRLELKKTYI